VFAFAVNKKFRQPWVQVRVTDAVPRVARRTPHPRPAPGQASRGDLPHSRQTHRLHGTRLPGQRRHPTNQATPSPAKSPSNAAGVEYEPTAEIAKARRGRAKRRGHNGDGVDDSYRAQDLDHPCRRDDLEPATTSNAAGRATLGDHVRLFPRSPNAINAQGQQNGGDGSTAINISGLGTARTLVLINGRASCPVASVADDSVALNAIPLR